MPDAGPNYSVERRRLNVQKLEHEQTIAKGKNRLDEIQLQKELNVQRAELLNDELDDEASRIKANEGALRRAMVDIDKKIELMSKQSGDG